MRRRRTACVCIGFHEVFDKVCGSWDNQNVGFDDMVAAGYAPGDFIVQLCVPREEEPTIICHTDNPFRNPVPLF